MGRVLNFTRTMRDSMVSLVAGLGTARDKAATVSYLVPTLDPSNLAAMFRASWLARKIVTIPALDATRKWRNWQAEGDVIGLIEDEERRLELKTKLLDCKISARLYGGAALYLGTGDGRSELPLEPESVKKGGLRFLTVFSCHDLRPGDVDTDPESPYFNQPAWYEIDNANMTETVRIHPSRLAMFYGERAPSYSLKQGWSNDGRLFNNLQNGWGDSVLLSALEAIKQVDMTAANIASLVFEAKIDIVSVPDLMTSLSNPEGESRLLQRFSLGAAAKGINGTLILDKEEEYNTKTASFATLPEVLLSFIQLVSGAADIPTTRLFGMSPGGLNASGDSDLRNYYDRVQSMQELELTPALSILDECLIRSATGARDDSIFYNWAPLWQVSDKEKAEIGVMDANIVKTLVDTGLFPQEGLANAAINMLTEHGVMPGLEDCVVEAGGLPDFEAIEADKQERELALIEAKKAGAQQDPAQDPAKPPPPKA